MRLMKKATALPCHPANTNLSAFISISMHEAMKFASRALCGDAALHTTQRASRSQYHIK
jgi:hypothetical protein